MADVLAEKIAEAKKKMFGDLEPMGSTVVLMVKGEAEVQSSDRKVEVRKTSS